MVVAADHDHETGPFGPPDGARADFEEIQRNFVDFSRRPFVEGLASPPTDRSARIIVGKKGVGKTVYLRRFQDDAAHQGSLYADGIYHDVPATEDVIRVCELYPLELAAEGWQWIWRRAIMRAVVSHLLCKRELRARVSPVHLDQLENDFRPLLGTFRTPHDVYSEARAIALEARSRNRLARDLRHRDWVDIENLLGEILLAVPPLCFYLDSVDEQFGNAPLYWMLCQKGLCQQVLELYRDERFRTRLHVVVSVRDLVQSSMMQGEHATRFKRARQIRVLDWDHRAISYFFFEKLKRLGPNYQMDPSQDGVAGWLGREKIYNPARGVDERLEDYLLRHTRQIPRDVVQLGNELCFEIEQAKAQRSTLSDEAIRRAVAVVSKDLANEQIAITANHLSSDMMPPNTGRQSFSDFYMSAAYSDRVQAELRRFIAAVGTDRFPMSKLEEALASAGGEILSGHSNPLHVLWLNGLLGYDPPDDQQHRSHFYGAHDIADFQFPEDLPSYVFHPVVGHAVHIKAAGDRPVRPFR